MRNIILTLFLTMLSALSYAQTTVIPGGPRNISKQGGYKAGSMFWVPVREPGEWFNWTGDSLKGTITFNPIDSQFYGHDGNTWGVIGSGGAVDSAMFVTITRLKDSLSRVQQTLDDSTAVLRLLIASVAADSAFFATLYQLDTTRAGLDMRIALKQNQLNGTGFVKASGTTISYDNSAYTPTGRTITINGTGYDLSANRSWTIPVPDTSSLRADIDANSDSILVHRADIDSKEPIIPPGTTADYWRGDKTWQPFPAIPDISGLIPYSDTGNLIATTYGVDTAKQNIRDEISNLPAPPVTSVNGQTGNVVLQFMDTAYVSGDTIYAEKGGNVFVVGVMTGGGSLDTSAVSAIVADSLSGVIRQGGNSFGAAVEIGSNDNQDVKLRRNNAERMVIGESNIILSGGTTTAQGNSNTTGDIFRAAQLSGAAAMAIGNNRRFNFNGAGLSAGFTYRMTSLQSDAAIALYGAGNASEQTISFFRYNNPFVGRIGTGGPVSANSAFYDNRFVIEAGSGYPMILGYNGSEKSN